MIEPVRVRVETDNKPNLLLCINSAMTKTGQRPTRLLFQCQPCDEVEDRDQKYTRSYDLIAHLVSTHGMYPIGIKHITPYIAVKSDLRPATAEEMAKNKDANKHRRKPEASTGKASASGTTVEQEAPAGHAKATGACKSMGESMRQKKRGRIVNALELQQAVTTNIRKHGEIGVATKRVRRERRLMKKI